MLLVALLCTPIARAEDPAPKPDVVVLLADDLGYADAGFNGCEDIPTPHLDRLAASGAVLTSFYVDHLCTPTRAALLTGRYPIRYGLQEGVLRINTKYGLPLAERTLSLALHDAGYTTALVGKWHLGAFDPAFLPTRRGFDSQYGCHQGEVDYLTHEHGSRPDWFRDDRPSEDAGYSTRLLAKEAVRVVREQPAEKPLFLYVAFNAVHPPYHFAPGREEDFAGLPIARRRYATMVDEMDRAIGEILDALDETGRRERALIVFSSDNGPGVGAARNGPLRGAKGEVYEAAIRAAACVSWRGRIAPGTTIAEPLHVVDWFPTIAKIAGVPLDPEIQERPLDGLDVTAVLTQGAKSPHDAILLHDDSRASALRLGDWKLVMKHGPADASGESESRAELYDLASDPGEATDLAEKEPERVAELSARLEAFREAAIPVRGDPTGAGAGR